MPRTILKRHRMGAVATAALLVLATPVAAQVAGGVTVYAAENFADSAPANAADMLARVPGFVIVEADEDVRGYAGAQGNVLIDGVRPASKRESIDDLLERIPAASVERIELIRGGGGIDMGGYPVLANVVRRRAAVVEGAVEAGAVVATDGWAGAGGQIEYVRRMGERSLDLALTFEPELDDDTGRGVIRSTATNGETVTSHLDTRTIKQPFDASLGYRRPLAAGVFTATAAVRGERAQTETDIRPASGDAERIDEAEDFVEAEAGLRYARPLGDRSTLEIIISQQRGWLDGREFGAEGGDAERFTEATTTGETIGRIDLTHEWSPRLSLSAALEGAFNTLESRTRLEENGLAIPLPGSDVLIEEKRAEASTGVTWTPVERWTFEAGLRAETSAISQTGDSLAERSFTYVKPRLAATWDVDAANRLRLSLSREVGQLDFGEFVASASLDTGQISAGNVLLEPDKTWRLTVAWERHFGDDGAVTATWTHDRISDVVDRILVVTPTDVFDAPGNIGDGRRDTLAVDVATSLDRMGFTGGRLRAAMLWRSSAVTDPVTGDRRSISDENPIEGEIEISQSLPRLRLKWGIGIDHIGERSVKYRFDEIAHESESASWTAWVERRVGDRWRLRAEITDLFGRDFNERRETWDGPRPAAPRDAVEIRERETPGYVSLTLRRSMGG